MSELKITIEGKPHTGKTTIMYLIENMLKDLFLNVSVEHYTKLEYYDNIGNNINDRLIEFKDNLKIDIVENKLKELENEKS